MNEELTLLKAKFMAFENGLRLLIADLDDVNKKFNQTSTQNVETIDDLKSADIEALPWTPYKSGKGSWIFANLDNPAAEKLCQLVEMTANGRLELFNHVYKFSGQDHAFISRFPKSKQ